MTGPADWLRVMPGGSLRLDIRATLRTDDGALIYITEEVFARFARGEVLTSDHLYLITAPTMQTAAEQYAWLNHVQCVGKVVEVKAGEYIRYDIFIVR